ncbi:MAG: hypothetical protein QOE61_125, partial [Micromonosporaceae bacterium]|nr:hypothetical protein [Micromonosporaceae bacterium]
MRLLLTSQPIYSHLVPALIPLARQASAAGHEVAVATAAAMADDLAALGVAHLPLPGVAGQDELRTSPELARRYGLPEQLMAPGSRRVAQAVAEQISLAYAGPMALRFADELLVAAERFKPDVIAHEPSEYGGYLVAEKLGIPHATVDMMPFQADELPLVAGSLDASRVRLGLPPTGDPWYPHRYLTAGLIPLAWYPPRLRSRTLRHYRLPADTTPTPLPVGFPPPRDGLPVVLAGL